MWYNTTMRKISKKYLFLALLLVSGAIFWGAGGLIYYYLSAPSEEFIKYFSGYYDVKGAESDYYKNRLPIAEKISAVEIKSAEIPILAYHTVKNFFYGSSQKDYSFNVTPAMFAKQMKYLKDNGYAAISTENVVNYFEENVPLPEKPVVITFDDGWESQYENALPVLKKYGFIATFFITTDDIGEKDFLSWEQVKKLTAMGMEIGSHTESHPMLTDSSEEELRRELSGSKSIIEENIGSEVRVLAYPYGLYDAHIISMAKDAGYLAARTTDAGSIQMANELLELRGNLIFNNMDGFEKAVGN